MLKKLGMEECTNDIDSQKVRVRVSVCEPMHALDSQRSCVSTSATQHKLSARLATAGRGCVDALTVQLGQERVPNSQPLLMLFFCNMPRACTELAACMGCLVHCIPYAPPACVRSLVQCLCTIMYMLPVCSALCSACAPSCTYCLCALPCAVPVHHHVYAACVLCLVQCLCTIMYILPVCSALCSACAPSCTSCLCALPVPFPVRCTVSQCALPARGLRVFTMVMRSCK